MIIDASATFSGTSQADSLSQDALGATSEPLQSPGQAGVTAMPGWLAAYLEVHHPQRIVLSASSSDVHSTGGFFASLLPNTPAVEWVYWLLENSRFTAWTVIDTPDDALESAIVDAQLAFMGRFADFDFDFSVLYRRGRSVEALEMSGVKIVRCRPKMPT